MSAPTQLTVNKERVQAVGAEVLEHLKDSGITSLEGLMVIESLYALMTIRGMEAAQGDAQTEEVARQLALRSLQRMESRVIAWPARTEGRQ